MNQEYRYKVYASFINGSEMALQVEAENKCYAVKKATDQLVLMGLHGWKAWAKKEEGLQ